MKPIEKTQTIPYNEEELKKCHNVWKSERYDNPILNKAYPLFSNYTRQGSSLIGNGELIGYLALFSGKAFRGCPPCGGSFSRVRGVGILYANENNRMREELDTLGLTSEKLSSMRFKGLKSNTYTLTINKKSTDYENGYHSERLIDIKFVGENDDSISISEKWSDCFTLDFK